MQKISHLVKIFIALLLLTYLFLNIDWTQFVGHIKNANLFLIILSSLLAYIGIYLSVERWRIFLIMFNIKIERSKLYYLYVLSLFFNNFLPTTVGGDVYKIVRLNTRIPGKKREVVASILLERGSGFLALFLINILLILPFSKLILSNKILFLTEIFIASFLTFFILCLSLRKLFTKIAQYIRFSYWNKLKSFLQHLLKVNDPKIIIGALSYSIFYLLAVTLAKWLLFYSFDTSTSFLYILFANTIIQISGVIPLSLNSLGVTEGIQVFLFSLIGIPVEISLAVALISRVSLTVFSAVNTGIFYTLRKKIVGDFYNS